MEYHIYHSTMVEISRDMVKSLGGDPMDVGSQSFTFDGDAITITGHHRDNVARCPNLSGYPTVEFAGKSGVVRITPTDWAEVKAWKEPEVVVQKQTKFTPAEFMRLMTKEELDAALLAESSDADIRRMWAFIKAVGYVDMTDPLTKDSLNTLLGKGILGNNERLQEMLDGVFKQ